jgi:hypothetical protein
MDPRTPEASDHAEIPRDRIIALHKVFHGFASTATGNQRPERIHVDGYEFLRGGNPEDLTVTVVRNPDQKEVLSRDAAESSLFIQVRGKEYGAGDPALTVSFKDQTVLSFAGNDALRARFDSMNVTPEVRETARDYYKCPSEAVLDKLERFAEMLKPLLEQHSFEGDEELTQKIVAARATVDSFLADF